MSPCLTSTAQGSCNSLYNVSFPGGVMQDSMYVVAGNGAFQPSDGLFGDSALRYSLPDLSVRISTPGSLEERQLLVHEEHALTDRLPGPNCNVPRAAFLGCL
jgi:hypothetical protein